MAVTVIIPTLNEEDWIASAVTSAFAAGAAEVIVADGGSIDRTSRVATSAGARMLLSEPMRARQLNLGADAASHETLVFLHADSRLPTGAAAEVEDALMNGADFGGFRIAFAEPSRRLRVAAAMINLRTSVTRCPWGDQAQFIRRETFLKAGRFLEMPLMEDYELAMRMKRRGDEGIVDGEDETARARVGQCAGDAEDRRLIVVRTFVNRRNRCRRSLVPLYRDHLFEDLACRGGDAIEE